MDLEQRMQDDSSADVIDPIQESTEGSEEDSEQDINDHLLYDNFKLTKQSSGESESSEELESSKESSEDLEPGYPRLSTSDFLNLAQESTERPSENSRFVSAANATPPVLPPSVEEAYKKKCIELKRRMNEVEEHNDILRLRKVRLERGIQKMRLERAILIETLAKRMQKQGADGTSVAYDDESEGSSEGPPTPQEKPLRSKRGHRRPAQSPHSVTTRNALPQHNLMHHSSSSYSTPIAPHPGPGPFSHTNGNPTSNPASSHPLPAQHANAYSTYQCSSLVDLPAQPQQPPSALELFMDSVSSEITRNPGSHANIGPLAFPVYCQTLYRNLEPRDREPYEREFDVLMTKYEQDMQAWEDHRRRLALRGGEGDGNGEEGEEEKMEGVEGGFTAVNG